MPLAGVPFGEERTLSTQPPEGTTAPADLSCSFRGTLVDVLDAAPGFAGTSARRLLRDRIARRLGPGRRLHLVEYDMTRLWFIALVDELAEEPGGLAALSRAVSDLQPGSRLAAEVARIVAAGAAGGARRTIGPGQPEPGHLRRAHRSAGAARPRPRRRHRHRRPLRRHRRPRPSPRIAVRQAVSRRTSGLPSPHGGVQAR
ncbi:hypothetical protein FRAHR75_280041 [Frankia sp. Hr75.2]|nr:hypothetical protein FRAHR75_280041 [Frankia sp. Hr75.2]